MTAKRKRKPLSQGVKDWLRGYRLYGFSPFGGALYAAQQEAKRRKAKKKKVKA